MCINVETTLKKLLQKVEQIEEEKLMDNANFETGLKEIMKRYDVKNDLFFSEVSNLHKSLLWVSTWFSHQLNDLIAHQ